MIDFKKFYDKHIEKKSTLIDIFKESKDIYSNGILFIVNEYRENELLLLEMIKKFDSPVSVLSECYLILVHSKEIPRLEDLPEEKKIEIWGIARTQRRPIKHAQALYTLQII